MTDPTDFPEPEPELEPHPDKFFSTSTVLRNLPFVAALALAIFGVAYSNFSGHPINGYWEFLAIAIGIVCVVTAWPNAPDRRTRFTLLWTQAAHWVAILVAMNLVLLQGFQQLMPVQAVGLVLMLLLGVGTFLAGINLMSLRNLFPWPRHGAVNPSHDLAETGLASAGSGRRGDCRTRGRVLAARKSDFGMTARSRSEPEQ